VKLNGLDDRIAQLLSTSGESFPVPSRLCDNSKATLKRAMSVAFSNLPCVEVGDGLEDVACDVEHECNQDEKDYCIEVDSDFKQEGQSNDKLGTAMATPRMIPHTIGCTSGAALASYCPTGDSIPHNAHVTCLPAVTSFGRGKKKEINKPK